MNPLRLSCGLCLWVTVVSGTVNAQLLGTRMSQPDIAGPLGGSATGARALGPAAGRPGSSTGAYGHRADFVGPKDVFDRTVNDLSSDPGIQDQARAIAKCVPARPSPLSVTKFPGCLDATADMARNGLLRPEQQKNARISQQQKQQIADMKMNAAIRGAVGHISIAPPGGGPRPVKGRAPCAGVVAGYSGTGSRTTTQTGAILEQVREQRAMSTTGARDNGGSGGGIGGGGTGGSSSRSARDRSSHGY